MNKDESYLNRPDSKGAHARTRAELLRLQAYHDALTGEQIPNFKSGSYHHLIKKEWGGDYTVENGVMFLVRNHRFLHNIVETSNPALYDLITECLFLYKECLSQGYTELTEQFQKEVQPEALKLVRTNKRTGK